MLHSLCSPQQYVINYVIIVCLQEFLVLNVLSKYINEFIEKTRFSKITKCSTLQPAPIAEARTCPALKHDINAGYWKCSDQNKHGSRCSLLCFSGFEQKNTNRRCKCQDLSEKFYLQGSLFLRKSQNCASKTPQFRSNLRKKCANFSCATIYTTLQFAQE